MKTLFTILCSLLFTLSAGAQLQWQSTASSQLQISEINGGTALSAGLSAGVHFQHWDLEFYSLRSLLPARTERQESGLREHGLRGQYFAPVHEYFKIGGGLGAGWGKASFEPRQNYATEGKRWADVWMLNPEVGVAVPLGPHFSLHYSTGFRFVFGASHLEERGCGSYSSLYNSLVLRLQL